MDSDKKDYMMCASCDKETMGLVSNHAYGILRAEIVTDAAGNSCNLVQLRNPWGKTEWSGDWSDKSDKWTDEAKTQCNLTEEDDGCFWMDYDKDFGKYFTSFSVCKT